MLTFLIIVFVWTVFAILIWISDELRGEHDD